MQVVPSFLAVHADLRRAVVQLERIYNHVLQLVVRLHVRLLEEARRSWDSFKLLLHLLKHVLAKRERLSARSHVNGKALMVKEVAVETEEAHQSFCQAPVRPLWLEPDSIGVSFESHVCRGTVGEVLILAVVVDDLVILAKSLH